MREVNDIVYHYCHPHLRKALQEVLTKALIESLGGDGRELSNNLYSLRPRSTLTRRVKVGIKELVFRQVGRVL